jgi:hypothetical protein
MVTIVFPIRHTKARLTEKKHEWGNDTSFNLSLPRKVSYTVDLVNLPVTTESRACCHFDLKVNNACNSLYIVGHLTKAESTEDIEKDEMPWSLW